MPTALKRHKLPMLKPRLETLDPFSIKMLGSKTLKQKQQDNGRTLALNGTAWRTLRALVLSDQPLCEHCADDYGNVVPATDVDHIDNDPTNNSRDNLSSLCHACHSKKTMASLHGRKAPMGCDVDGVPLDPCHPWRIAAMAQRSQGTDSVEPSVSLHACDRSLADHG
ncbi:HNH endonuclease signature motif containing protein [Rhodoferax ferrireducens]|uniref:HNH endonuclease n=1 Tax=Rhodoferax ferrireducens TaxID=192843 RepID=UPI00298E2DA8|nr:HNH endonuclease signature motif containing protein [Rhodoferax ferrireducens]WPC65272.1 HNH endonuclease signature motif containing protein [Rhodoferax ferrireducens]